MIRPFSESRQHTRTGKEFVVVCPLWVPYVRVGQERWTPRAKRYLQSRDALAKFIIAAANQQGFRADSFQHFAVSTCVFLHERKSRRKGEGRDAALSVGTNRGDIDNYLKAAIDAAQTAGIVSNDSPDRFVSIGDSSVYPITRDREETGAFLLSEIAPESISSTVGNATLDLFETISMVRRGMSQTDILAARARHTREG